MSPSKQCINKAGAFDALVIASGRGHFEMLSEMTDEKYQVGIKSKLMGSVNLVLCGLKTIRDHGSFTLTSGILNREPITGGSSAAMINGALEGFVRSASQELPRNIRINIVSPTLLQESLATYADVFPGYEAIPAEKAARAYVKSILGIQNGQRFIVDS